MASVALPAPDEIADDKAIVADSSSGLPVGRSSARRSETSRSLSFTTLFLRAFIWGPAAVLILSAFAVTGGIALFLVPLAGLFYAVFCVIAWNGPDA
jgi:hypothetical protein